MKLAISGSGLIAASIRRVALFFLALGAGMSILPALGQSGIQQFDATTAGQGGIESIDLSTLNVRLNIPILQKPGRGLSLQTYISHDNNFPLVNTPTSPTNLGWQNILQNLTGYVTHSFEHSVQPGPPCGSGFIYSNWYYVDPAGTPHSFPKLIAVAGEAGCPGASVLSSTAGDGSGLTLTISPANTAGGLAAISSPSGYSASVPALPMNKGYQPQPNGNRSDLNGNYITVNTSSIEDTLGNSVEISNYLDVGLNTSSESSNLSAYTTPPPMVYSYYDSNGNQQTVTLNYGVFAVYAPSLYSAATNQLPGCSAAGMPVTMMNLPTSIAYANGTSYGIQYESYNGKNLGTSNYGSYTGVYTTGRISQLTLPTGGTIKYSYVGNDVGSCDPTSITQMTRTTLDGTTTYTRTYQTRQNPQDALFPEYIDWLSPTTTIVDPAGNAAVYTFTSTYTGPNQYSQSLQYFVTSEAVYKGPATGIPESLTEICYNGFQRPCANQVETPFIDTYGLSIVATTDTYVSLDGTAPSRTTTHFSPGVYLPIEKDEYAWGGQTLVRKTLTNYYTANSILVSKPTSIVVQDGNKNIFKQTTYGYDETTPTATSGVPQHAAVAGQRGNLTSESVWRNTDGAWLKNTYTNDDTGNRLTVADPNGNPPTKYSYADSWYSGSSACPVTNTNAFLTQTTDPLGHISKSAYDACTGLKLQDQDPNDIAAGRSGTTTSYDSMFNPTEVQYADGGSTSTSYGGYAVPLTVTRTTVATPNPSFVTASIADGYGRTVRQETTSDPSGADYVDTTYDSLGREQSVSNPYRHTTDSTYGITSFLYDPLGRMTYRCQPDNSTTNSATCVPRSSYQSWSYNGAAATFTDESGNQWKRTSDALGRLIQVVEPSGASASPTLTTGYSYDMLDNLIGVTQSGGSGDAARGRSFTYDSLSRLVCAANPENSSGACPASATSAVPAGTTQYQYDANGNLISKTDARGVVASFSYDALNRVLSNSYSDRATLSSCFLYDGTGGNRIGRLTNEWTQAGACPAPPALPSSGFFTLRSIASYDSMGRLVAEQRCTPSKCSASSGPILAYGYDLAGNPTGLTNSVGASGSSLALTTGFDAAGHMNSVTSNWGAYATGLYSLPAGGYSAVGPVTWTHGSNLTVTQVYDNRLRVTGISASGQVP